VRDELIQTGEGESLLGLRGRSSGVRQVESVMGRLGWVLRFMEAWIWMYNLPGAGSALADDGFGSVIVGLGIVVRRFSVTLISEGLCLLWGKYPPGSGKFSFC